MLRDRPTPVGDPGLGGTIPYLLKKTVPAAGTVPGSDESDNRLSVVRARRRATTRDQRGAHNG